MALNTYYAEEHTYFNPEKPSIQFGYYLSWSGMAIAVYPFESADHRDHFERVISWLTRDDGDVYVDELCALLALSLAGEHEGDSECADEDLQARYPKIWEDMIEAAAMYLEGERWPKE